MEERVGNYYTSLLRFYTFKRVFFSFFSHQIKIKLHAAFSREPEPQFTVCAFSAAALTGNLNDPSAAHLCVRVCDSCFTAQNDTVFTRRGAYKRDPIVSLNRLFTALRMKRVSTAAERVWETWRTISPQLSCLSNAYNTFLCCSAV